MFLLYNKKNVKKSPRYGSLQTITFKIILVTK